MAGLNQLSRSGAASNPRAGDTTSSVTILAAPTADFFDTTGTLRAGTTDIMDPAAFARAAVIQVDRVNTFTYATNVLQMGDPFSAIVPDPRGALTDKLMPGWSVRFYMANALVNGGAPALKVSGIVVDRQVTVDAAGGTQIRIQGADLGWHLMNNDAPLWFNLRGVSGAAPTLEHLAEACVFPQDYFKRDTDPGWGFERPIRVGNAQNRSIKRGLRFTAAERLQLELSGVASPVQVQPGQKISDLLSMWARRAGLLVGVSADRHLQFFLPDYAQAPEYEIHLYGYDDKRRSQNNVQNASRDDTLETQYTHVTVVGEDPVRAVVADGAVTTFAPQFSRIYGRALPGDWPAIPSASAGALAVPRLPFRRRATLCDGEIVHHPSRRARWFQNRGLFDAQTLTFQVRGHHQNGLWWEADTMCAVRAPAIGVEGDYYMAAVECSRDMSRGDTTRLTLKRPNLLTEIPV